MCQAIYIYIYIYITHTHTHIYIYNLPGRSGCSNPSEAGHLPPIVRAQLKELKGEKANTLIQFKLN